ncbi:MAG: DUF167 family protein [Methylocella sp.]
MTGLGGGPWTLRGDGVLLSVRLTPKSSRDEIGGAERLADGRIVLKVRVRAVPQDGEANAALIRLIAKSLGIPAASVRLESGATGRLKTLMLSGGHEALCASLASLYAPARISGGT